MQTFLPYPDYRESIRVLDPSRLGNQVYREATTLLAGGWPYHPACRMWRGHHHHLALYVLAGLKELHERGLHYWNLHATIEEVLDCTLNTGPPKWLGREDFHASHRSALLRKNPIWYGEFGWSEPPNLPYVWPTRVEPKPVPSKKLTGGKRV